MSRKTEIDVKTFMKQNQKIPIINKNTEYVSPKEYAAICKRHHCKRARIMKKIRIKNDKNNR